MITNRPKLSEIHVAIATLLSRKIQLIWRLNPRERTVQHKKLLTNTLTNIQFDYYTLTHASVVRVKVCSPALLHEVASLKAPPLALLVHDH